MQGQGGLFLPVFTASSGQCPFAALSRDDDVSAPGETLLMVQHAVGTLVSVFNSTREHRYFSM